jgi:hypothetical protein
MSPSKRITTFFNAIQYTMERMVLDESHFRMAWRADTMMMQAPPPGFMMMGGNQGNQMGGHPPHQQIQNFHHHGGHFGYGGVTNVGMGAMIMNLNPLTHPQNVTHYMMNMLLSNQNTPMQNNNNHPFSHVPLPPTGDPETHPLNNPTPNPFTPTHHTHSNTVPVNYTPNAALQSKFEFRPGCVQHLLTTLNHLQFLGLCSLRRYDRMEILSLMRHCRRLKVLVVGTGSVQGVVLEGGRGFLTEEGVRWSWGHQQQLQQLQQQQGDHDQQGQSAGEVGGGVDGGGHVGSGGNNDVGSGQEDDDEVMHDARESLSLMSMDVDIDDMTTAQQELSSASGSSTSGNSNHPHQNQNQQQQNQNQSQGPSFFFAATSRNSTPTCHPQSPANFNSNGKLNMDWAVEKAEILRLLNEEERQRCKLVFVEDVESVRRFALA